MKQYIKKALWIIPFVFSLNLSAATYYLVGTTNINPNQQKYWSSSRTGSIGTSTASVSFSAGDIYDFNNKSVDIGGCTFRGATIQNQSTTAGTSTLTIGASKKLTITVTNITSSLTSSKMAYNFSGGTVVYDQTTSFTIFPTTYGDLEFTSGSPITGLIASGTTVTVNGNLYLESNTIQNQGTFILGSSSSISNRNVGNSDGIIYNTSIFTDNRTTKTYSCDFVHATSSYTVPSGDYTSKLTILSSSNLGDNITVKFLTIGTTTSPVILNLSTLKLTITGNLTLNSNSDDSSGINCTTGTLELKTSNVKLRADNFRSATPTATNLSTSGATNIYSSLTNIKNIILNGSSTSTSFILTSVYDRTTTPFLYTKHFPTVTGNFTITKGNLQLEFITLKVEGFYQTNNTPVALFANSTTDEKLDLSGSSSQLILVPSTSISQVQYDAGLFVSNKINKLQVKFADYGNFQLADNLEISTETDLYNDFSSIDLNGNTITLKGSLVYSSNTTSGLFIGGTTSNIKCSTTSTIFYFNQDNPGTSDYIENFEILNSAQIDIGTNLTVKNLKLGTGYLNINDQQLTINNSLTNTGGSGGGSLIGSLYSNLICSTAVTTLYFDQTAAESNRTVRNLTITDGADITLGNWLNIAGGADYGLLTVGSSSKCSTSNYLILTAGDGGNAQVDNSPGTITGNIHVQTYFPSTKGRAFRFLAPQVVGGSALSWRDSGSISSGTTTYGTGKTRVSNQGIQITGSGGATNDFDESTTNKSSAYYFDENIAGNAGFGSGDDAGWVALTSGSQSLDNGKGYRVLVRGDRSIDLKGTSGSAANNVATTTQITGTYVGTSKTIRLYNSGSAGNNGINLIGNPYPATIDWDAVVTKNSGKALDPTYVIYEPGASSYSAYSSTSQTGNASNYISSGQGFLVYTTTNNTDIVIDESCKNVSTSGDQFFKKIRTNHLVVKMNYDTLIYDKTFIYFLPGATNYYDKYDAGHIQNIAVNLASIDSTNTYYNINCLDSLVGSRIIPLTVEGTPAGSFQLSFEDCGTFADHDIYLVDKYLKKTTKLDDWTTYTLDISSDPFSYENGRLNIVFEPKQNNAIVKLNKSDAFKLGPNPVKDYIRISNGKEIFNEFKYEIANINGQTIMKGSIDNSNDVINTSKIPTGIYFITVNTKTETQTIKFIK